MLSFILTVLLSKVAIVAVPVALAGLAVFLFVRGFVSYAIVAACVAGGWLATGLIYQEGVSACEARVAREVARLEAEWQVKVDDAKAAVATELDALEADNAAAEVELETLIAELAARPDQERCILTEDDARAGNGR